MSSYTIAKIYDDGRIDVSFDVDAKVQNLSGAPLEDKAALDVYLANYCQAYEVGLRVVAGPTVSDEIVKIVGKAQVI